MGNIIAPQIDSICTLKGTKIRRYKNIVGKRVGRQIYVHKDYAHEILGHKMLGLAQAVLQSSMPDFQYNCVMYSGGYIRFDSAPDFDTAREPHVGKYVSINLFRACCDKIGESKHIWHHKWLWVKDDYKGFNVAQSKKWSQFWLGRVPEIAKGTDKSFYDQLKKYGIII